MLLKEEEKNILTGIVGTIGIHLLVLVIFLIARLEKVHDRHQEQIVIEFDEQLYKTIEQLIEEKKQIESKATPLTQEEVKNIAVNTANQLEQQISTDKYIENLKKELNIEDLNPKPPEKANDPVVESEIKKPEREEKKKSEYHGPTRISYFLKNRTDRYIHRPIYKCQGGGKVVVSIMVNNNGEVINANIESTSTPEGCVSETALESAYRSLFNIDLGADPRQKGTITYEFVAQ
ncbi:MAG: energy transducer TonB [Bacteroidales bacterium]|nr:energy transducer TonB [Bacteroidales bacterium]